MQDGRISTNHRITQTGERAIVPPMIGLPGAGETKGSNGHVLESLGRSAVLMMGGNPALPVMPEAPSLMVFLQLRPDPQLCKALYEQARAHPWYDSARIVTLHDEYAWEPETPVMLRS